MSMLLSGGATPFTPTDWAQLRGLIQRQAEATQNLSLPLLPTSATYRFSPPTVTNVRFIVPRRTYEVDANPLLTLYTVSVAASPFVPYDWMRQQQVQVRNIETEQNRLILPTTLAPFSNNQIAVERAPFTPQRQAEALYQNLLLTYRGQMPFFPMEEGLTRPSLIAQRYTDDPAQNLDLTLLSLNPAYAFRSPTVTNVRFIIPRRTYEIDQNLSLTLLSPVSVVPFAPTDWAQLRGVIPRQSEQTQNLSLTLLPTTMRPFVPQKASDDRAPMICVRQYENVQNLSLTLLPSGGAPPVVSVKPKRHLPMMGVGR